jgi:hypothetical protein
MWNCETASRFVFFRTYSLRPIAYSLLFRVPPIPPGGRQPRPADPTVSAKNPVISSLFRVLGAAFVIPRLRPSAFGLPPTASFSDFFVKIFTKVVDIQSDIGFNVGAKWTCESWAGDRRRRDPGQGSAERTGFSEAEWGLQKINKEIFENWVANQKFSIRIKTKLEFSGVKPLWVADDKEVAKFVQVLEPMRGLVFSPRPIRPKFKVNTHKGD